MSFLRHLRVELNRVFCFKTTWIIIALTMCMPLAGYFLYFPATDLTKASVWIANPALAGALGGAVLFGFLIIRELDRVHRNHVAVLTDAIASPVAMDVCRVLSVIAVAVFCLVLTTLAYLPVTLVKMGRYFLPVDYFAVFFIFMLPSLVFGVLAAAACYHIFRRVDVSFVAFVAFVLASLSPLVADDFILRWVNPLVPVLSDDFGNAVVLRTVSYNRLFWLLVLVGLWIFVLLFVRCRQKGLIRSFTGNVRKSPFLCLGLVLMVCGVYTYIEQPFVDHSPIEPVFADIEADENLCLLSAEFDIKLNESKGTLYGTAHYKVDNNADTPAECFLQINPGYSVHSVKLNGNEIPFQDLNNDTDNRKEIAFTLPAGANQTLAVEYGGFPQMWSYVRAFLWQAVISPEFVDISSTGLCPSLMTGTPAEAEFSYHLTLADNLTVLSTGDRPTIESENGDGTNTWLLHDVGTSRMIVYAAEYEIEILEEAGMYIEFYYSKNHKEIFDRLGAMDTVRAVLNYCAGHYGPLDYTVENPFRLGQDHALAMGGGAWDGLSVMGETTFSEENLNNPALGASGSEVLAHEMTHQWWGLTWMMYEEMTGIDSEWTSEGLTCYTTYRMMKELYGEEYARTYYADVWEAAVTLMNNSFYYRNPEYLEILPDKYVVSIHASQLTTLKYSVMPLKLMKAGELLGGEDKLDEVLSDLFINGGEELSAPYNDYYITYNDFLNACGLTKEDLELE